MQEIKDTVEVHQTILVVDAMTGQDAVNVASSFHEKIGIDGVIITKLDGDTRGGAALSIKAVTGCPILYAGMGEKLSDLEQFYPDRMASRILGMGDVLTLIEKAGQEMDETKAREMAQKMKKAQFDFNDYLESMQTDEEDGRPCKPDEHDPGDGNQMKNQGCRCRRRRKENGSHGSNHFFHDRRRKSQSGSFKSLQKASNRQRSRSGYLRK